METPDLNSSDYWESDSVDLRMNPLRPVDTEGLDTFLSEERGLRSAIVLATSGSSGRPKFIVLSKRAILASADAVNAHCGLVTEDVWLGGLSTFHVGGLGIYARAYRNGAKLAPMAWNRWTRDGVALLEAITASGATLTSLTPTHLWDLVRAGHRCPDSLRGVFLGGGAIDPRLVERAEGLGWTLWPTYGMTETSSQVATATGLLPSRDGYLPLLSVWEAKTDSEGRLWLRGSPLCEGWAEKGDGDWHFIPARNADGWFRSSDQCDVREGRLRFLARDDGTVKISGELVSLSGLNDRLQAAGVSGCIVSQADPRRGNALVLVREPGGEDKLASFLASLAPIEQIAREVIVSSLPRTDAGKADRAMIAKLAQ